MAHAPTPGHLLARQSTGSAIREPNPEVRMPLHPQFVHLPIALAVLMPLVSVGLLLSWWRGWLPKRAFWIAAALQALLVGSGLLALRTGHADEERVEQTRGEAAVDAHEEAAEVFVWGAGGVLALALGAALLRRERAAQLTAVAATVGTLAVLALGYRTGQAGGHLVYGTGAAIGSQGQAGEGGEAAEAGEAGERERDGDDD
jgi:uncharacterized membrane protein